MSEPTKVLIVGTGDAANGLAHMYSLFGNKNDGAMYELFAAEPLQYSMKTKMPEFLHKTGVPIVDFDEAILTADILILSIPAGILASFITNHFNQVKPSAIWIDATNCGVNECADFKYALEKCHMESFRNWCKGLNDNGALYLLQLKASEKNRPITELCGPDEGVVANVKGLAEFLGFSVHVVPHDRFDNIRSSQSSVGIEWIHASIVMTLVFLFSFLYMIFIMREQPNFTWDTIILRGMNKSFAWTCIWGFALAQLPGLVARLRGEFRPKIVRLPSIVLWGLGIRKHVGLLALFFLYLHMCLMLLIFNTSYYGHMLGRGDDAGSMEKEKEVSMLFGVVSSSLYILAGIASLPSVNRSLNKAQAMCVFGQVVWWALIFGFLHVLLLAYDSWGAPKDERSPYSWGGGNGSMPPTTLMASVLPMLAIFLKLIVLVVSWTKWLAWLLLAPQTAPVTTTTTVVSTSNKKAKNGEDEEMVVTKSDPKENDEEEEVEVEAPPTASFPAYPSGREVE